MADSKPNMSKDPKVIEAVGYGFDASVRKGTEAGRKAMEGFMSKLTEEQKMFARDAFNKRIETQSAILNDKKRLPKGEQQVKVYRQAANEKPSRSINYQKTFGKKMDMDAPAPKKTTPSPKAAPTAKAAPKSTPKFRELMQIPVPTASTPKPAAKPSPKPAASTRPKAAPKVAPKVDKTPLPQPDMGFRPFAKADKPKPQAPRSTGTGMSQMLNIKTLGDQYIKKKP